jgi:hypothetical protein
MGYGRIMGVFCTFRPHFCDDSFLPRPMLESPISRLKERGKLMRIFPNGNVFGAKINIEDAVAQTLERRFKSEIPNTVPDCYIDLTLRNIGGGRDGHLFAFTGTGKIEALEAGELSDALVKYGVKTLGLLDPHCQFKMFVAESLDNIKKDLRAFFQSYQADFGGGENNVNIDSFVFEAGNKHFAYTDVSFPHFKRQIESKFESFFKAGGAVVSVQDRYAPITRFVSQNLAEHTEFSTLFCEIADYEIHIWVAVNCGNGVFSPLIAESNNLSSIEFLLDSVTAQTSKQYHFLPPTPAILIDGRKDGESGELSDEEIETLLANYCGEVVKLGKEQSLCAGLNGARLLSGGNKKKKEGDENKQRRQVPRVNATPLEWAHNYLIPIALWEFYRKGIGFIACLAIFICLCTGAYWFAGNLRLDYEREIAGIQGETERTLQDYSTLKNLSEEFSRLAGWRNNPDVASQYSAISSFLTRNNCLLEQAVFYSKVQDLPQKTLEEIGPEVERMTGTFIGALDLTGIWDLSARLPISGVGTSETRKNVIEALQKDAAASFGASQSLLVPNEEHGQNTINILKNENGANAVFFVWRAQSDGSGGM